MNTFIKTESQSELPSIELTKLEHVALIGCHNYEKFVTFLPSVIDCEMLRLLCAEVHRSHPYSATTHKEFFSSFGININTKTVSGTSWHGFPWSRSSCRCDTSVIQL